MPGRRSEEGGAQILELLLTWWKVGAVWLVEVNMIEQAIPAHLLVFCAPPTSQLNTSKPPEWNEAWDLTVCSMLVCAKYNQIYLTILTSFCWPNPEPIANGPMGMGVSSRLLPITTPPSIFIVLIMWKHYLFQREEHTEDQHTVGLMLIGSLAKRFLQH